MPNWCSNYVFFTGSEENIQKLSSAVKAAIKREEETNHAQVLTGEIQDGYFYELYLSAETKEDLSIMYETRWAPNIPDVALTCKAFGVEAEHEYSEPAMDMYGTTKYKADGTYEDEQLDQRFLDLVWYNEDDDIYVYLPTEERNECREELIDKYYPIWKAENQD